MDIISYTKSFSQVHNYKKAEADSLKTRNLVSPKERIIYMIDNASLALRVTPLLKPIQMANKLNGYLYNIKSTGQDALDKLGA